MKRSLRICLVLIALFSGAWVIFPDPVPLLVDDVIAGVTCFGSLWGLIRSFIAKAQ